MLTKLSTLSLLSSSRQRQSPPAVGFFPTSEEERDEFAPQTQSDERYSEISGISYVDPYSSTSDNRKQLNFDGNPPTGPAHFYPSKPSSVTRIVRKRPVYHQQQSSPYYTSSYPTSDQTNPFYQNYANQYQHHPLAAVPTTPAQLAANYRPADFYQPTRYPSSSQQQQAQLYHQQALFAQQQPTSVSPNYYTNNYANQFHYGSRPSPYGQQQSSGLATFLNNLRGGSSTSSPFGQITSLGGQFSKALDDITQHDDLQCVPKILCQMVQGSRRPGQSQLMNVPGLSM